jgi:hypothetical protein
MTIDITAENGCLMRKMIIEDNNPKNSDSNVKKKKMERDSENEIDKGVRISKTS